MGINSGTLGEKSWGGGESYFGDPDTCDASEYMGWNMVCGVTAQGSTSEDWNEIDQNASNKWRVVSHFGETPEHLIWDHCGLIPGDPSPWPEKFTCTVTIASDEDPTQLYFSKPEPSDNDNDSGNDLTSTALSIIGGVGSVYTSIVSTLVDYSISGNSASVDYSNGGGTYDWTIPLENDQPLPTEDSSEATTTGGAFKVQNKYASGSHDVIVQPSYTFGYGRPSDCGCINWVPEYTTTAPITGIDCSFDAI